MVWELQPNIEPKLRFEKEPGCYGYRKLSTSSKERSAPLKKHVAMATSIFKGQFIKNIPRGFFDKGKPNA